jgi:hypothetical protein
MSRFVVLSVLLVLVVVFAGCVPDQFIECSESGDAVVGSGNLVTLEEEYTGFDAVDVSHAFQVEIRQGETFAVVVRVDDNLQPYVRVDKVGDTLKIGLETGGCFRDVTMEAEITMPELAGLYLSGASHATVTGFSSGQALAVRLSGASSLRGDIEAGDVRMVLSGASNVSLDGSAQNLRLEVSGASHARLADFPAEQVDVEASGASSATVNASGRLDGEASGASEVRYVGSPTLGRMYTSGSGSIRQD